MYIYMDSNFGAIVVIEFRQTFFKHIFYNNYDNVMMACHCAAPIVSTVHDYYSQNATININILDKRTV